MILANLGHTLPVAPGLSALCELHRRSELPHPHGLSEVFWFYLRIIATRTLADML